VTGNSDSTTSYSDSYTDINYDDSIAPEDNLQDTLEETLEENLTGNRYSVWRQRVQTSLRYLRRLGASTVELSLLTIAAAVPFSLGWYANQQYTGKLVPLNPMLTIAVETVAESLTLPGCPQQSFSDSYVNRHLNPSVSPSSIAGCPRPVAPVTNLLWSVAIAAPGVLAIGQLYRLGKTGQTWPKSWFKIQVVTNSGNPPGVLRAFWRETIGKWAVPLTIAYWVWWWTGAMPDLLILAGLTGVIWLLDGMAAAGDSQKRTLHDRWARTLVMEITESESNPVVPWQLSDSLSDSHKFADDDGDDDIDKAVMGNENQTIVGWLREHQEVSLVAGILLTMIAVMGVLVSTQMYVQKQANWRSRQAQENEKFLKLVDQFAINERQGAILALGSLDHPEAGIKMLTDLLGLEDDPQQIETIGQALVSAGPEALPYLQKLNQALRTDIDSLRYGGNETEQQITALRQRSTQRAIAKIIRLYSGEISNINLNRIDLGQQSDPAFTLVLEKINLSGIQLRGAILTGASFQGSQFYGAGGDRRFGTFDDTKADLSGAQLTEANLTEAFLTRAIMEKINLTRANLNRANLQDANLIDANLSSAQLVGSDLRHANLTNAKLTGANLGTANLSKVELSNGRLSQITAKAANFQLANLSAADLHGSDLSEVDLANANLQNANLEATNLSGAYLMGVQLQNANLQDADLTGADFRGANLSGADVRGAILAPVPPKKTDSFIVKSSDPPIGLFQGVDLSEIKNLDLQQMSYLCTQGAVHPDCRLDKQP
jgi:uncharacterized protein YjbI with pentapeptide repeats